MDDLKNRTSSDLQSESWSTTTVYDAVYEGENAEAVNVVQGGIVEENQSGIEEEVYEEYDGDYEEYMPRNKNMRIVQEHENSIKEEEYEKYIPRYATYSKKSESITQKFLKKKMIVILVLLFLCTVGVVAGLSVHFTTPTTTTTLVSTTSVSRTTMIPPTETASATGTIFSI